MTSPTALISGAGVAGPTLAFWLARAGWRVTLVERAAAERSSGNPVDVRGPAFTVAAKMGLTSRLRDRATHATAMRVIDGNGRRIARIPMPAAKGQEVEIGRSDLASVLLDATRDDVELLLDDTITTLTQDPAGVDVTFAHAQPRRLDVVIGADGLHSTTRRLAFGPEFAFVEKLGLHVATMRLGGPAEDPDEVLLYNTPGRLVSIHPARGEAIAAFIFRTPTSADSSKQLVIDAYAGAGWRVPELLERLKESDDVWSDAVSRVRLPSWSNGRITLLGDAASCVSLFGDGSTLAMAGAHTLAEALTELPPQAAFQRYESRHRTLVTPKQRTLRRTSALLVPATRTGLAARNTVARCLTRFHATA
ncbi:2-polyprenyl-6-methoxyphenol hydroxylase-like FAD-dependent oxidoreductase [Actinoplanes lutulentus]|uniref:2-polyprenyl-6-methoxyphenol hydroxylase-like FAD-dependent oxidoreductase n=1 Tax=Actinoplanes lutulentus TaxID=1287878 RepID=A0A327Z7A1_9ACTN|nr:FAD-dependent monooxygenase [Actinoplanes lutulentus]MBB2940372.1 2-polyprenyl-6-methoxyphenol hydroxylase-like FAD-dependent oxidoreductase [Actinoplanes lutulentus]RAK28865.1 2-polyprenyl-6-methoxyphenol hydroxylase-like FAD-dependent oxidoreductase [Actinoplanes lutulentus]